MQTMCEGKGQSKLHGLVVIVNFMKLIKKSGIFFKIS